MRHPTVMGDLLSRLTELRAHRHGVRELIDSLDDTTRRLLQEGYDLRVRRQVSATADVLQRYAKELDRQVQAFDAALPSVAAAVQTAEGARSREAILPHPALLEPGPEPADVLWADDLSSR